MAIKEHPIPQNITTYKFRLVGNMTLAQFLEVLGGIAVAFLIWKSPFYPIIKYPLVLFFGGAGALIAFVPIEERPLDVWLTAFVKKIYNPTLFIYQRTSKIPLYKTYQPKQIVAERTPLQQSRSAGLLLDNSFSKEKTIGETRVENYIKQLFANQTDIQIPQTKPKPKRPIKTLKIKRTPAKKGAKTHPEPNLPVKTQPKQTSPTPDLKSSPKKQPIQPQKNKASIKTTKQPTASPKKTTKPPNKPKPSEKVSQSAEKPTFDTSIPKPNQANLPTGIVVDENNQPIVGAVVEIQDKNSGLPVRVTKTNIIGQFILVTPLPVGKYIIIPEKDNYSFQPIEIELNNQIIPPLKIKGKALAIE